MKPSKQDSKQWNQKKFISFQSPENEKAGIDKKEYGISQSEKRKEPEIQGIYIDRKIRQKQKEYSNIICPKHSTTENTA